MGVWVLDEKIKPHFYVLYRDFGEYPEWPRWAFIGTFSSAAWAFHQANNLGYKRFYIERYKRG